LSLNDPLVVPEEPHPVEDEARGSGIDLRSKRRSTVAARLDWRRKEVYRSKTTWLGTHHHVILPDHQLTPDGWLDATPGACQPTEQVNSRGKESGMRKYLAGAIGYSVLLLILPSDNLLSQSVFEQAGHSIGQITDGLFGPTIQNASQRAVDPLRNAALEVVSNIDVLLSKHEERANDIARARLAQLQAIIVELNGGITDNLDRADQLVNDATDRIRGLQNDLFRDIDRSFQEIYRLTDDINCKVMGRLLEVELLADDFLKEVKDLTSVAKVLQERFLGGRERVGRKMQPSQYYREIKKALLSKITPDTPVSDILYVLSDLQLLARRMHCMHQGTAGSETYARDLMEFERRYRIWNSQY
jgi:hypothetical protein